LVQNHKNIVKINNGSGQFNKPYSIVTDYFYFLIGYPAFMDSKGILVLKRPQKLCIKNDSYEGKDIAGSVFLNSTGGLLRESGK
jgi:hypothetical protein